MKKRPSIKLVLSRESLRVLGATQLVAVAGATIVRIPAKSDICVTWNNCFITQGVGCVPRTEAVQCITRDGWC